MVIPALLACTLATPQPPKPNWELATIKSVICSNVVVVAIDMDPDLWVNLLGAGTPETVDPLKGVWPKLDVDFLVRSRHLDSTSSPPSQESRAKCHLIPIS